MQADLKNPLETPITRKPTLEREEAAQERPSPRATRFIWFAISCGILLRVVPYVSNRSFWLDEAYLALNIVHRTYSQLLKPLDYNQGGPPAFLILERLAVQIFGPNEYALRLFPFLCGILSLFLFYRLAKLCLSPKAVPIAVGLFAIMGSLIYYTSECKQYSSDVMVAMVLFSAAIHWGSRELTASRVAGLALVGAASIWFSQTSVFILAGTGSTLALSYLAERRWGKVRIFSVVVAAWAFSFAACYFVSLRDLSHNQVLAWEWSPWYPPSPLFSADSVKWFVNAFFETFRNPAGLELTGIAALTFLVGCVSMFATRRRDLLILISPICFTLLASGLHRYPFTGRMLLFIVPALLLLIAEGVDRIRVVTADRTPVIAACVAGLLFLHPLLYGSYDLFHPITSTFPVSVGHAREEIKPVLNYIKERKRPGDVLYVFDASRPAFMFYAPKYGLDRMNYVFGQAFGWSEHWEDYEKDVDSLRGNRRVWLLFSHLHDQGKFFSYLLNKAGTRLDHFESVGAEVELYDLGATAPSRRE